MKIKYRKPIYTERERKYLLPPKSFEELEIDVEPISERINGFIICKEIMKYKFYQPYYFLVNENDVAIYFILKDEELNIEPIQRSENGHYLIYVAEHYNFHTYPGQDRETEYSVRPKVYKEFTEFGEVVDSSDLPF